MLLAAALVCILSQSADAQLRIVSYNTLVGPRLGMDIVLEAIGEESSAGISKPIDVLLMQEQNDPADSTQDFVDLLNGIYGAGTYDRGTVVGGPGFASIRQSVVFNTTTVELIGEVAIGATGGSAQARQVLRHQLRPLGYDSAADFYAYNSHYKAGTSTSDKDRRLVEANTIRNNSDALGQGAYAIYAGDFNMQRDSEDAFQRLLDPGNGQAFDPINQLGSWNNNSSFAEWHTQSPCVTGGCSGGQTAGGIDDRFDFQLVTAEVLDGEGFSYIPNTYHTFGNKGLTFNRAINDPTGPVSINGLTSFTTSAVLNALENASDHLPVVVDYQIPAFLEAITDSIPTMLGVGQNFDLGITIRNAANVLFASGADELDYTITATSDLTGNVTGTKFALDSGTEHFVSFDTATPGVKGGTITISTDSQGAANSLITIPISYQVGTVVAQPLPIFQSFESLPGGGGEYTISDPFDDGDKDFFDRFAAPSTGARAGFTGFDGSFAIFGQDHDGDGGATTRTIEIPTIDITGQTDLVLSGLFGANSDGNRYETINDNLDGIEIFIRVDGGDQVKIAGFAPDATGQSNLFLDTDLDGIGDGASLTFALTEFAFPFTVSGTVLDVIFSLRSTASLEPLVIDMVQLFAPSVGLAGDYNDDGIVDAADYTVWLDALGGTTLLNEGASPGIVDTADYDFWKANFGATSANSSQQSVPEPGSLLLIGIAMIGLALCRSVGSAHKFA